MAKTKVKASPLMEYCAGAVAALTAQFEMTKVLGHAATAGAARESLIQNFLITHLPEMNRDVSGVIVDAKGKRGENIRSVRKLTPSSLAGVRFGELSWPHGRILSAVVTYNGAFLPAITNWLNDLPETDKPDLYLDLSKGILLKNEGIFEAVQNDGSQYILVDGAPLGLARFLVILANVAGMLQGREVKWEQYIG